MGSRSKKRKKDKKRSRSRSRSSERHRSRRRSRSTSRSRSRSPTHHKSSKHKKHKKRSSSRSRSRSRERYSYSRRSRSRSRERSSRRSSRSRSRERSSRRSSRSRSRERSSRYRRSRSRSSTRRSRSRSPERRRRKRSKSKDRQKSPDRSPERGDSFERIKKEEESENDPPHLNPAEAIHQKMRKALEAAASADAKLREQGLLSNVKQEPLSRTEQVEREQVLQNLESESFVPSAFVSSRDRQVQPSYLTKEQSHENAIFGGVGVPSPAVNGGGTYSYGIPITYKRRGQLASKYLSESAEVKEKRWLEKLQKMRRQKLEANPDYFNRLLTIKAE